MMLHKSHTNDFLSYKNKKRKKEAFASFLRFCQNIFYNMESPLETDSVEIHAKIYRFLCQTIGFCHRGIRKIQRKGICLPCSCQGLQMFWQNLLQLGKGIHTQKMAVAAFVDDENIRLPVGHPDAGIDPEII